MKSRLNNCYCNQDLHRLQLQQCHQWQSSHSHSRHSTRSGSGLSETRPNGHHLLCCSTPVVYRSVSHRFQRHQFSGQCTSAGELLHTPQRIPTFMATVRLSIAHHTVCGVWMSLQLGTLSQRSVHPASPVLLTR